MFWFSRDTDAAKNNSKGRVSFKHNEDSESDTEYQQLAVIHKGSWFGELALIEDKPRAASIICNEPCYFGVLSKEVFINILKVQEQEKQKERIAFFRSIPYFSKWTGITLSKFWYNSEENNYIRNQVVFKEGKKWDKIYIIKTGEFELTKSKDS